MSNKFDPIADSVDMDKLGSDGDSELDSDFDSDI